MTEEVPEQEDLRFNVLNHVNVPLHAKVPEEEVPAILERFGIQLEQLPKIRADDPAARVVDAQQGEVVKITRKSLTAGHHVAYRLVVHSL